MMRDNCSTSHFRLHLLVYKYNSENATNLIAPSEHHKRWRNIPHFFSLFGLFPSSICSEKQPNYTQGKIGCQVFFCDYSIA
jgi:hypothetical protein